MYLLIRICKEVVYAKSFFPGERIDIANLITHDEHWVLMYAFWDRPDVVQKCLQFLIKFVRRECPTPGMVKRDNSLVNAHSALSCLRVADSRDVQGESEPRYFYDHMPPTLLRLYDLLQ